MAGLTHNSHHHPLRGGAASRLGDPPAPPAPDPGAEAQQLARIRTEALLRDLWRRKQPMVREHVRLLQRTLEILTTATLTAPLRSDAAIAAHKLAGSLGMFGFHDGTRYARELEQLLDSPGLPPPPTFASILGQLMASLPL